MLVQITWHALHKTFFQIKIARLKAHTPKFCKQQKLFKIWKISVTTKMENICVRRPCLLRRLTSLRTEINFTLGFKKKLTTKFPGWTQDFLADFKKSKRLNLRGLYLWMWFQFGRRTARCFRLGPAHAACNSPVWAERAALVGRRKLPTNTQASFPVPTKQKTRICGHSMQKIHWRNLHSYNP